MPETEIGSKFTSTVAKREPRIVTAGNKDVTRWRILPPKVRYLVVGTTTPTQTQKFFSRSRSRSREVQEMI